MSPVRAFGVLCAPPTKWYLSLSHGIYWDQGTPLHSTLMTLMTDSETSRIVSLEKRLERLTSVLIIQSILLSIVLLWSALSYAPIIALLMIAGLPVLVFYRHSLPGWARAIGRFGRQLVDATRSKADAESSVSAETPTP